jgi:hypothetical protein
MKIMNDESWQGTRTTTHAPTTIIAPPALLSDCTLALSCAVSCRKYKHTMQAVISSMAADDDDDMKMHFCYHVMCVMV